jgi:two-component system NtrC family sensor kinase
MSEMNRIASNQLEFARKLTCANWLAWIKNFNGAWEIVQSIRITSNQSKHLRTFLGKEDINKWISGALINGRMRRRNLAGDVNPFKSSHLLLFPNTSAHMVLLAGTNNSGKDAIEILRLLAVSPPTWSPDGQDNISRTLQPRIPSEASGKHLFHQIDPASNRDFSTGITFENILIHIVEYINCEASYMAVRRGESFSIKATWRYPQEIINLDIQIEKTPALKEILRLHTGIILERKDQNLIKGLPHSHLSKESGILLIPITIGQRVIGNFCFITTRQGGFSKSDLFEATNIVNQYAYIIENAILFEEATRYLQQLALLNELAATASSSVDVDQVSKRVMQRLRRIFNIDWAAVHLLSQDKLTLREYGGKSNLEHPVTSTDVDALVKSVIRTGHPVRINNLLKEWNLDNGEKPSSITSKANSELVVPLKYSSQTIGALSLTSSAMDAFSPQDEQLLILIASNLAGLFENMRLNRETQERAQKLEDMVLKLQESQKALVQSEKMAAAGRLMASIAHEINNPLQALQNCLHLVGRQELEPAVRENYLKLAQNELVRLMNTTQRMLDYYRPGGLDRKPIDIHDLLEKTISLAQKQLYDYGIIVKLELSNNLPYTVAVKDQIQQVFLNLILNAIEAMKSGGELKITTSSEILSSGESLVSITFQDSGTGIPKDLRSTLFEPFVSAKENGLGLGLAVSYGIIIAHEGNLELVENDLNGACFRITLKGVK